MSGSATAAGGSESRRPGQRFQRAEELARELRRRISGEVRFDAGSRALYATDASNYRQVPIGVVLPRSVDEVLEVVEVCRRYQAPVLARGGGTSLAGQCCNVAVVIDTSKYLHRVLEVDAQRRLARVEPGVILDHLQQEARGHGLLFGPDPATHSHCTLGGMIGNNSCGAHSVMAGTTADNVEELEVLTYGGTRLRVGPTGEAEWERILSAGGRGAEVYGELQALRERHAEPIRSRFPDIPRRVSGYNLPALLPENGFQVARALVGSEGTCVVVLEALVRLVASPLGRSLLVLGYPSVFEAADDVGAVMAHGPIALEGIDDGLVQDMRRKGLHAAYTRLLPEGNGWLIAEFGGQSEAEAEERARRLAEQARRRARPPSFRLVTRSDTEEKIWAIRESGLGATAFIPGQPPTWEGWEDSSVPPEKLGAYLRDLRGLMEKHHLHGDLYGHFGQGCVHTRIDFDLATRRGIEGYRAFVDQAADLVVRYGGSLSGEHGDGQSRAELLEKMFGAELVQAFRRFKRIWDPDGMMNPGKIVDPYRLDENLRLGPRYQTRPVRTHFSFAQDEGSFARAALRCVGVGECRRLDSGLMCPSFMVTREEKHSTRGRARLLFEMMTADVVGGGWREPAVKEALDLCLACKGCKSECPVNVDMATYKAEFLSHYYARRLRPRAAYAMGLIRWWARLASRLPWLANLLTQREPWSRMLKALGGIAPARRLPRFAPRTFRRQFRPQGAEAERFLGRERRIHSGASDSRTRNVQPEHPVEDGGLRVLLWPDTFNDHFHPQVAHSAVSVLGALGFRVSLPAGPLCCGRPLYDWGMLGLARRTLRGVLKALAPEIRQGTPIVGLEPSCVAVFRDELSNLFPHDQDARRLAAQFSTLGEFLAERAADRLPRWPRKAIVQAHCHQRALFGMAAEAEVLRRMGVEFEILDSGCCGMAGSFGFEKDKYEVSMRVGERVLLPRIREAAADTLVVADGFSCREQILQATGRRGLHLAEVIELALREARAGAGGALPEPAVREREGEPAYADAGGQYEGS